MSGKVISIDNSLFQLKKKKESKQKLPTQSNIKKELLKKISEKSEKNNPEHIINTIKEIESLTKPIIQIHEDNKIVEKPIEIQPQPLYGCLSGGKNPTYRKWKHTLKNKEVSKPKQKLVKSYATFGKTKKNKICVLIQSNDENLKIDHEKQILSNQEISDIRNYLINHGIIKYGSTAPEHILRDMYIDASIAGDIYNKSTDVLLHNYLNKV
jgi:hypothetical protein